MTVHSKASPNQPGYVTIINNKLIEWNTINYNIPWAIESMYANILFIYHLT